MKKQELKDLLDKCIDLNSDYGYLCHKAPLVLEALHSVKRVPSDLKDLYEDCLREVEYINNNL